MYKLSPNGISVICNGSHIPFVEGNSEYQKYLNWLSSGNTPTPAYTLDEARGLRISQINAAADIQIEQVGGWTVKKQLNAERGMYDLVNPNAAAHARTYVNTIVNQSNAHCDAITALTGQAEVFAYSATWDHAGLVSYELMKTGV